MESNLPTERKQKFRRYYQSLEPLMSKQKNRIYTAAILSFFAISLFGWYAIRPTLNTIIILRKEIEEKKEIDEKMDDKIASLIEAQSNYQQIESDLVLLEEAIPKNPELFDLTRQMENIIASTESTMSSYALANSLPLIPDTAGPGAKANPSENKEYGIGANLLGDYLELEKVINFINVMRRMVNITNLTFSDAKKTSGNFNSDGWLNMAVQLKTFFKP